MEVWSKTGGALDVGAIAVLVVIGGQFVFKMRKKGFGFGTGGSPVLEELIGKRGVEDEIEVVDG